MAANPPKPVPVGVADARFKPKDVKKPGKLPGLNPPDLGNKSFLTQGSLASSVSLIACSTILVSIRRSS